MKRIIAFLLGIVFCINLYVPETLAAGIRPDETELYSLSAVMIDGDSGRVLYEKNGNEVRAMASTTKIMTLIIALEYGNMDDLVTVTSYAAKMPDVQLGICEGEQYYMRDLVYSMMLESHNDSAVAIAEHIGGDVSHFAAMMNKKAIELGLDNTYFITPNGLDAEDADGKHSTTATELALIMKYCIMDSPVKDDFVRICQTREYSFTDYEQKKSFSVTNKNRFLDMMDGVIAGKTGFTADAGYCYVAAVNRDEKTYVIALLGCGWPGNKQYKWADARKLFQYGIDSYMYESVVDNSYKSGQVKVKNGIEKAVIDTYIDDKLDLLISNEDNVEIIESLSECIEAPVKKGDIVGSISVYVNGEACNTVNVYSSDTVKKVNLLYYIKLAGDKFLP